MKVILDKLWNEPVLIASVVVAVAGYFETSPVAAATALVGGVILRHFTTPARKADEQNIQHLLKELELAEQIPTDEKG